MQVELFMVIGYVLMSSAIGVFAAGSLAQLAMRADGNTEVQPFVRASYVASTALMVGGAACTLLHLGNIGYFYGILTNFGSWLTRESWLVGGFAAMCVAASVLAVRGGARKPLAIVGVLGMIAGTLLLFSMSMAYMTAHAIPSWNDMGVLVTNLAEMFALGSAAALLLVSFFGSDDRVRAGALRKGLSIAAIVASVGALLAFVSYFATLTLLPDTSVVMNASNTGFAVAKMALLAIAVAAAIALERKARTAVSLPLVATFAVCVLASDVLSRILHFTLATHIPLVF